MYGNTIHKNNGYDPGSYTYYPIAIIGAGESGIAMGCRLKEVLGFDQFRIFDRQAGIGGTWWINRYPGVACDVQVASSSSVDITDIFFWQPRNILLFLLLPKSKMDNLVSFRPRNCQVLAWSLRQIQDHG